MKLRFSQKAKKFDEISMLVLTLLSNVKTKMETSSNFVVFSEYMNCNILQIPVEKKIIAKLVNKTNI